MTGGAALGIGDGILEGYFSGRINRSGHLQGTASYVSPEGWYGFDVILTHEAGQLQGQLTEQLETPCADGGSSRSTIDVFLQLIMLNDHLEPNDHSSQATEIGSGFTADLLLPAGSR